MAKKRRYRNPVRSNDYLTIACPKCHAATGKQCKPMKDGYPHVARLDALRVRKYEQAQQEALRRAWKNEAEKESFLAEAYWDKGGYDDRMDAWITEGKKDNPLKYVYSSRGATKKARKRCIACGKGIKQRKLGRPKIYCATCRKSGNTH